MNNSVKEKSRQGESDLKIMDKSKDNIVLFHRYIPEKAKETTYLDGSADEISEKLVDIFKNEIKVLN